MTASMRCITCGGGVTDPPQLHRLENGSACPTCRDRALEAVPAALPRRREPEPEESYQRELFPDDDDVAG